MEVIDKKDVQGILVRGYSPLAAACFLLLKINSAAGAKSWLAGFIGLVTDGESRPEERAVNISFTLDGLKTLGLGDEGAATFPYEFEEGMDSLHKQGLLGDYGKSDPANWKWGGKRNEAVHLLLLLYAKDNEELGELYGGLAEAWEAGATTGESAAAVAVRPFTLVAKLDTKEITARKEHFGFHDGISQPTIRGLGKRTDTAENTVAAGEFILGYENEYGQYTASPAVPAATDKAGVLAMAKGDFGASGGGGVSEGSGASRGGRRDGSDGVSGDAWKDLGRNGSYLVFRQMEQDVHKFWDFMEDKTRNGEGVCDPEAMIRLASKVIGRWPSGAPLELSPEKDNPQYEKANNFNYFPADKDGLTCPFGAHVRRSNPRDAINRGDSTSVSVSNKHRILRRGRSYGLPLAGSMEPEDILKSRDGGEGERGLYFICLNADLVRQFEFIQNFWINNPKFDGLYDERDPLTGNHSNPQEQKKTGTFSIPGEKLRQRFTDLPEFITLKGGSYFFLPGISALRYLSSL